MRKIALLAMLVLAGCALGEGSFPQAAVTPTVAPVVAVTLVPVVTVTLVNQTTEVICGVYAVPSGAEGGGYSLLDPGEVVLPGGKVSFEVTAGTYDLRAENCFGIPLVEERGVAITAALAWRIVSADGGRGGE